MAFGLWMPWVSYLKFVWGDARVGVDLDTLDVMSNKLDTVARYFCTWERKIFF